ncbi:MAG: beta-carotene 15,15'-monooxygenase [Actinomycetaceae bacterium]|nr:beta-carotene 15,15'-monooxygenase [Actinomycetaceae bacterium]
MAGSLSALGAGMAGLVDDMGDLSTIRKSDPPYEVATDNLVAVEHAKGFKGHLGALRQGRVTTGIMKIVAIGGTAACAATVLQALHSSRRRPAVQALGDWVVDSALIAGMANMHNLFDLRPGRALKVGALLSTPGMVSPKIRKLSANTLGAIAVALPNDLNEHTMLGDTGANALGAVVGVQIAAQASRPVKFVVFLSVAALTMISEKVSFSKVIESCRLLKAVDSWGRRPH